MKRFLSWVVLYLISVIVSLVASLVVGIGYYLLGLVSELDTLWRIATYLLGGSAFLGFIFAPAYYGAFLSVLASEAIKPTKKGTRYCVLSILMLISNAIYIIVGAIQGTFFFNSIIMCIYYIFLIVLGREATSERD
jgi:hypothetical protein